MSVKDAHAFVRRLRENPELVPRETLTMEGVIEAGRAAGYTFDEDDLRAAHAHDWVLHGLAFRSQTDTDAGTGPDMRAANPRAKAK
jgi:predicted ribosomally synthesized peptide with nif11-like leader